MLAAPLPANEPERLEALARYAILDTLPEEAFDRVTRLAAELLGARLAAINFVDQGRQWGKSCVGVASTEAGRETSFCAWTILEDGPFTVPDTRQDARFADNPMVTGEPHIQAYAGIPLVAPGGERLGSLCVTFERPHDFTPAELRVLGGLAGMVMDELELRRRTGELEQQVRLNAQLVEKLERANGELDAFTRSVSHDLRAPVRHIQGFAELLSHSLAKGDAQGGQRYTAIIQDAAGRMNRLIDDLLSFSRFSEQPLHRQDIQLDPLVQDVRAALEPEAAGRQVEWRLGALPAVYADPSLLRQVLVNLLGNALKYSRRRELSVVEVWGETTQTEHLIHVRDNGAGFDPRYGDKLFGVFSRLHRADEFEGTGVGLATVQRIVTRHGGRVWAQGEPDKGATFSFALPRSAAPQSTHAHPTAARN